MVCLGAQCILCVCTHAAGAGQEHFYLEPNVTYAEPTEEREIKVWASTQNPTKTQHKVAAVLGVPQVCDERERERERERRAGLWR